MYKRVASYKIDASQAGTPLLVATLSQFFVGRVTLYGSIESAEGPGGPIYYQAKLIFDIDGSLPTGVETLDAFPFETSNMQIVSGELPVNNLPVQELTSSGELSQEIEASLPVKVLIQVTQSGTPYVSYEQHFFVLIEKFFSDSI